MTTVFRIERLGFNHLGVCQSTGLCQIYSKVRHCDDDGFDHESKVARCIFDLNWRFAFPSMDKLVEWFPDVEGRERMHEAKAIIIEYEVDKVIPSKENKQAIFDFNNAKPIGEYNIATLEKIEK